MPDLTIIGTVLTNIKTASDIAKLIRESSVSLSDAESKFQTAELIGALADLKMNIADLQEQISSKDREIQELKNQINTKSKLKFDGTIYWLDGDHMPFCTVCYEKDNKQHHLTLFNGRVPSRQSYYCKICNSSYSLDY